MSKLGLGLGTFVNAMDNINKQNQAEIEKRNRELQRAEEAAQIKKRKEMAIDFERSSFERQQGIYAKMESEHELSSLKMRIETLENDMLKLKTSVINHGWIY